MNTDDRIAAYARCFETLRPETLDDLRPLIAEGIQFSDPFNRTVGAESFLAVFRHMFAATQDPRFVVGRREVLGATAYLHWQFSFGLGRRRLTIDGISELRLDDDGRIAAHIDHWDAASQLYAKLPVLGPIQRWLARRFSAR